MAHIKKCAFQSSFICSKRCYKSALGLYFSIGSKPRQRRRVLLISYLNSQFLVHTPGKKCTNQFLVKHSTGLLFGSEDLFYLFIYILFYFAVINIALHKQHYGF